MASSSVLYVLFASLGYMLISVPNGYTDNGLKWNLKGKEMFGTMKHQGSFYFGTSAFCYHVVNVGKQLSI